MLVHRILLNATNRFYSALCQCPVAFIRGNTATIAIPIDLLSDISLDCVTHTLLSMHLIQLNEVHKFVMCPRHKVDNLKQFIIIVFMLENTCNTFRL